MMTSKQVEQILLAIYSEHNPGKMDAIPDLLIKYKGKEQELINVAFKKYGITERDKALYLNLNHNNEYTPNNRLKVIAVLIAVAIVAVVIVLIANRGQNEPNTAAKKEVPDTNAVTNVDSLKAEKEWSIFYKRFRSVIAAKDKRAIADMTSPDFNDGGGGETIEEWLDNVLFAYNDGYDAFKTMLDTTSYQVEMGKGKIKEKTNESVYFTYKNEVWMFGGIVGD